MLLVGCSDEITCGDGFVMDGKATFPRFSAVGTASLVDAKDADENLNPDDAGVDVERD